MCSAVQVKLTNVSSYIASIKQEADRADLSASFFYNKMKTKTHSIYNFSFTCFFSTTSEFHTIALLTNASKYSSMILHLMLG